MKEKILEEKSLRQSPLKNVRVLDCTWATGGPYGTLLLAMLGAEVIKVENPPSVTGVSTRQMLLPGYAHQGEDIHFLTYNRNKKSMVIDLRSPKGRQVFHDMVAESDVVFDNFRPGVVDRLGIDYETLRHINPRIICTSASGFGSTGPDRERPAFDTIIEASSGVTHLLSRLLPEGVLPPCYPGVSWADHVGGLAAAFATLVALYAREFTGEGRRVDVGMQDILISMIGYLITGAANFRPFVDPLPGMLWGTFRTKDGHVVLCGHRDGMWRNLARALGREEWLQDARYDSIEKRQHWAEELRSMVEEVLATDTTADWLAILTAGGVPCGPINSLEDVIESPQVSARNMIVGIRHKGKEIQGPGNPFKMSGLEERFEAPPELGQHTDQLLKELLGYSPEKIAELRKEGAIA
jgi:crotonobetainyl-CoA:carnitine CoA-transferase CaiB-like acyl-CoA transferase